LRIEGRPGRGNVKTRTLERHKGAAPKYTSATYKGYYANDILSRRCGKTN
jgi:hypothetical protein